MAKQLSQKTFKVEFEFTVSMDELEEKHLGNPDPNCLAWLTQLQKALIQNETALSSQMRAAALNQLQGIADYLAAQDTLAPLKAIADELDAQEVECMDPVSGDFADLTRPLRTSSMSVQLESSRIHEKTDDPGGGEAEWQEVWRDLRQDTELGKLLEQYCVPNLSVRPAPGQGTGHHLLVRYLTRQPDGTHIEARCTCEEGIHGMGADEQQALATVWDAYKKHLETSSLGEKIQVGLKALLEKSRINNS